MVFILCAPRLSDEIFTTHCESSISLSMPSRLKSFTPWLLLIMYWPLRLETRTRQYSTVTLRPTKAVSHPQPKHKLNQMKTDNLSTVNRGGSWIISVNDTCSSFHTGFGASSLLVRLIYLFFLAGLSGYRNSLFLYLRWHSPGVGWAGITNCVDHVTDGGGTPGSTVMCQFTRDSRVHAYNRLATWQPLFFL